MLAQRYPGLYDGIASSAPAVNLNYLASSLYWPQLIMALAGEAPHPCELDALTTAAVAYFDGKDGVVEGLISDVGGCDYNPFDSVGNTFTCTSDATTMQINHIAAVVANAYGLFLP